jgi:hypothetical protein
MIYIKDKSSCNGTTKCENVTEMIVIKQKSHQKTGDLLSLQKAIISLYPTPNVTSYISYPNY